MDLDVLGGIAEGVKEGISSFKDVRRDAEEAAMRKRAMKLDLFKSGIQESPEGDYAFSPEKQEEQKLGLLRTKAETQRLLAEAGKSAKEAKEGKKPTKDEFNAAGYANRLAQAEDVFKQVGDSGTDLTSNKTALQRMIPGFLGGLKPEALQLQEQAERNFVNAVLRRESGAAISPTEFDSAIKQYFPRPGDAPEVLRQKEINRKIVASNIQAEAGNALGKSASNTEIASAIPQKGKKGLLGAGPEAVAKELPQKGQIESGYKFMGGDPSDKNNWKKVR